MAFLGPDTRAFGERSNAEAVTQNQNAATLAALLGEDYNTATPRGQADCRCLEMSSDAGQIE
jgi:hypothetical protein